MPPWEAGTSFIYRSVSLMCNFGVLRHTPCVAEAAAPRPSRAWPSTSVPCTGLPAGLRALCLGASCYCWGPLCSGSSGCRRAGHPSLVEGGGVRTRTQPPPTQAQPSVSPGARARDVLETPLCCSLPDHHLLLPQAFSFISTKTTLALKCPSQGRPWESPHTLPRPQRPGLARWGHLVLVLHSPVPQMKRAA